jgi:hypothetical protein
MAADDALIGVLSVPGSRLCSVIARLYNIRKILAQLRNRFKSHNGSLSDEQNRPMFAYVRQCRPELGLKTSSRLINHKK